MPKKQVMLPVNHGQFKAGVPFTPLLVFLVAKFIAVDVRCSTQK
jgi:hypothetical protein